MTALCSSGAKANGGTRLGSVAIRSASRLFHLARRSWDGAQPIKPGWGIPTNLTSGRWRDVAKTPLRSQIALWALGNRSATQPTPSHSPTTQAHKHYMLTTDHGPKS